ncbi:MAG: DUF342 domain-containing protein [Desulfobacter sp.]|nr:MAG: DUF342 domain-containing protein [Desulfobacter sp.]
MKSGYLHGMNADTPSEGTAPDRISQTATHSDKVPDIFGHNNKALISLAVKCRLVTPEQESALLQTLVRKRKEQPGYTAVSLFKETNVLSETDIDFLFAVREHLEMKMLDKKFGELGVANRLVEAKSVQNALDIQSQIFKETNQSKLIGDILLENREISRADKAAILLTQDRIKDEFLAEAMNDIAASEMEKINLNMRFGAIAVKKGYITLDHLNRALAVQEAEAKEGKPKRYLGGILKELFDLSDDRLSRILQIQKELEKKRLSLETALERYNTETSINKRLAGLFEYRFAKNKLEARLRRNSREFEDISVPDLKRWISSVGIVWGICPDSDIQKFLTRNTVGDEIVIAAGQPPEPGSDGTLEFYFDTANPPGDREGESGARSFVKKGEPIARRIPASPGKPGKDVSGFTVAAPEPLEPVLNCGAGVIRDNDLYFADVDGSPVLYRNRTLFVKEMAESVPTRHHTGAIDTDMEDRWEGVNLRVDGSVLAGGKLRCRNLTVSGSIKGQVSADGEIIVKGEIGNPSGGDPAIIRAEGDVQAAKTVSNAIIVTAKGVKAPGADLSAAAVQALEDIIVKNVLDTGPRPCVLQTGNAPNVKAGHISSRIRSCRDKLEGLSCARETRELEDWFRERMELKDTYLEQNEFLKYLLALIKFPPLAGLPGLADKIRAARTPRKEWANLPRPPECASEAFRQFEKEFMATAGRMSPDALEEYIIEQADIKYGMYRASVSATRRYKREYEARRELIREKIDDSRHGIKKLEREIRALTVRKDAASLSRPSGPQAVPPAIRVKNKVAKGTVIKGKKAVLKVDRDIFGVKFTESHQTSESPSQIVIQGFYD